MGSFEEPKTPNNNNGITTTPKNTTFTRPKWPSSRRNHSLSSNSSSSFSSHSSSSFRSLSNDDSPPPSPPQRIPFSWESIPGIPKHQIIKRLDSSSSSSSSSSKKSAFLPLPPAATPVSSTATKQNYKKKDNHIVCRKDPFFAALVECSKGDDDTDNDNDSDNDDQNKVVFGNIWRNQAKSLSHRLGFVNFSCKNTCSVSESLVFLPRVQQPKRISYGLVKKHSG